jgi:hypothetical protein
MFDLEQSIADWRRQMLANGLKSPQILDELESHLREETRRLAGTGLPESEAFQTALQLLGKCRDLRDEFGKIHTLGWANIFSNPWQLNLLALCFIIHGLAWLQLAPRNVYSLLHTHFLSLDYSLRFQDCYFYSWFLMSGLTLPIGLGLIHRQNRWRKIALAWSSWYCACFLFDVWNSPSILRFFAYQPPHNPQITYHLLYFIPLPYPLLYAYRLLQLLMNTVLGFFVLTRPHISNLFQFTSAPLPPRARKNLLAFRALEILTVILLLAPLYWFYEFQLNDIEAIGFITVLLFFLLGRVRFPQRFFSDPQDKLTLGVAFGMLSVWCVVYLASLLDSPDLDLWNFTRREFWALVPFLSFISYALAGKMADHENALRNQHFGPNLETGSVQHV